jgi:hypothetical protein
MPPPQPQQRQQQQERQQLEIDTHQNSSSSSSSSSSRRVSVNAAPYADSPPGNTSLPAQQQLSSSSSAVKATMQATDGNAVTAKVAYALSDVAFIYPITPATPMGEAVEAWAADGRRNLHGNMMQVRTCCCCQCCLVGKSTERCIVVAAEVCKLGQEAWVQLPCWQQRQSTCSCPRAAACAACYCCRPLLTPCSSCGR